MAQELTNHGWDAAALEGGLYAWKEKYPVVSMSTDSLPDPNIAEEWVTDSKL